MLTYSNPMEEFSHAAYLIKQAAQVLDRIAKTDREAWAKFEARLCDAGADRLELIAAECDLVSHLIEQADHIAKSEQFARDYPREVTQ